MVALSHGRLERPSHWELLQTLTWSPTRASEDGVPPPAGRPLMDIGTGSKHNYTSTVVRQILCDTQLHQGPYPLFHIPPDGKRQPPRRCTLSSPFRAHKQLIFDLIQSSHLHFSGILPRDLKPYFEPVLQVLEGLI